MARRGQLWPQPERQVGIASTAAAAPDPAWSWSSGLLAFSNAIDRVTGDWSEIAERGLFKVLADRERSKPVVRDQNGNIVFELPNVDVLSRYGILVRDAAAQRYADALVLDTDKHLSELHGQFQFDPDKFATAAQAYVDKTAQSAPPEVAAPYRELAYKRIAEHTRSIALARVERDTRESRALLAQLVERASSSVARAIGAGSNDVEASAHALNRIRQAHESGLISQVEAERLERRITVVAPVLGAINGLAKKNDVTGLLDLARAAEIGSGKFAVLDEDERREVVQTANAAARAIDAVAQARREDAKRFAQQRLWQLQLEYIERQRAGGLAEQDLQSFAERALKIARSTDQPVPGVFDFLEAVQTQLRQRERLGAALSNPVTALVDKLDADLSLGRQLSPGEFHALRTVIETLPEFIERAERDGKHSPEDIKAFREAYQKAKDLYVKHQNAVLKKIEEGIKSALTLHGREAQTAVLAQHLARLDEWRGVFPPDASGNDPIDALREAAWQSHVVSRLEQDVRSVQALADRLKAAAERGDLNEVSAVNREFAEIAPMAGQLAQWAKTKNPVGARLANDLNAAVSRFHTETLRAVERGVLAPGFDVERVQRIVEHTDRLSSLLRSLEAAVERRDFDEASRVREQIRRAIDDPNAQVVLETLANTQTQRMRAEGEKISFALQEAWDRVRQALERGATPSDEDHARLNRALSTARSFAIFASDKTLLKTVGDIEATLAQQAVKATEVENKNALATLKAIELYEKLTALGVAADDPRLEAINRLPVQDRVRELEQFANTVERQRNASEAERRAIAAAKAAGVGESDLDAALAQPTAELRLSRLDELTKQSAEQMRKNRAQAISRWAKRLGEIDKLMGDVEKGDRFVTLTQWSDIVLELSQIEITADELEASEISQKASLLRQIAQDFANGTRGLISKNDVVDLSMRLDDALAEMQQSLASGRRLSDWRFNELIELAAAARAVANFAKSSELSAKAARFASEVATYDLAISQRENAEAMAWREIGSLNDGLSRVGRAFSPQDWATMRSLPPQDRLQYARKIYDEAISFWTVSGQVADYLGFIADLEATTPQISELRGEIERALSEPDHKLMLDRLEQVARKAKAVAEAAAKGVTDHAAARQVLKDKISGVELSSEKIRAAAETLLTPSPLDSPEQRIRDFALILSAGGEATNLALARLSQLAADPEAVRSGASLDAVNLLKTAALSDRRAIASLAARAQSDPLAATALALIFVPSTSYAEFADRFINWVGSGMPPLPPELANIASQKADEAIEQSIDPSILSSVTGARGSASPMLPALVRGIARGFALLLGDAPSTRQMGEIIGTVATSLIIDGQNVGWSSKTLPPEFFLGLSREQFSVGLLPGFKEPKMLVQYPIERHGIDLPAFGEAAKILSLGPTPDPLDWLSTLLLDITWHWFDALRQNGALAPFGWDEKHNLIAHPDFTTIIPADARLGKDLFVVPVEGTQGRVYNLRVRTRDGYFVLVQRPTEDGRGWVPVSIDVAALRERVVDVLRRAQAALIGVDPESDEKTRILSEFRAEVRRVLTPPWVQR